MCRCIPPSLQDRYPRNRGNFSLLREHSKLKSARLLRQKKNGKKKSSNISYLVDSFIVAEKKQHLWIPFNGAGQYSIRANPYQHQRDK